MARQGGSLFGWLHRCRKAIACAIILALAPFTTGCFGPFVLTKAVHRFNSTVPLGIFQGGSRPYPCYLSITTIINRVLFLTLLPPSTFGLELSFHNQFKTGSGLPQLEQIWQLRKTSADGTTPLTARRKPTGGSIIGSIRLKYLKIAIWIPLSRR